MISLFLKQVIAILKLRWESRQPKTFNEKIKYKSAHDRRTILTVFADKIKVRDYIAVSVGSEYLTKIYCVSYNLDAIDWQKIPEEFVFKVNHGSKGMVMVSKSADPGEKLPKNLETEGWNAYTIHPKSLNKEDLIRLGKHWLKLDYWWFPDCGRMPEWAYKNIKKGAIFEELLITEYRESPADYKFHIFNGKCKHVNVIHRFHAVKPGAERKTYSNIMDTNWKPMNVIFNENPSLEVNPTKPIDFNKMLEIVEKLANGIDYLRVDLYKVGDRILVGELTNYPVAGQIKFNPESFDLELGQKLILDKYRAQSLLLKVLRKLIRQDAPKNDWNAFS